MIKQLLIILILLRFCTTSFGQSNRLFTDNSAYYDLTLQDFLTFRAKLIKWSYDNLKGNNQQKTTAIET